jgi:hypothetical protein
VVVWVVLLCLVVGGSTGAVIGLRQVLFVGNGHFVLRQVNLRQGDTGEALASPRRDRLLHRLRGSGVVEGTANLFALDLRKARTALEDIVEVQRAEVRRRLPDALDVVVYYRYPVAQYLRVGGRLLDAHGWILPDSYETDFSLLPVITGIRDGGKLETGERLDDPLGLAALELLAFLGTESYGQYYDISTIQVQYTARTLRLHMREHGTFRARAQVVLPVRGMEAAVRRATEIVKERTVGRQSTGFIDATYEINIPVLP